jgi:MinD-like ATPase involved in chromosome partitioning or flagellar assembly
MVLSGTDDQDEPEPEPGTGAPEPGVPEPGPHAPRWPASGLPPSFGQRSTEAERPAAAGPGYGGFRPLGSLPPGGPVPGSAEPRNDKGQATGAAFGAWETYEAGQGHGWAGGYGMVTGQGWAQSYDEPDQPYDEGWPYEPPGGGGAADGGSAVADGGAPGAGVAGPGAPPEAADRPAWQAESADSLTADLLLRGRHVAPPSGWRRALYQVTGGLVRAPQSAADRRRQDLVQRARTPVAGGHHRVAVLSLKGGVGKTTTAVGLGATLASLRGDRVIAMDANPDRGTLCDKLRLETAATVRDLLNEEGQIQRYADVRGYTTQAASGLEVLASDRDPTVSVAFSDQDYEDVARVLEHYYSVSITDCGTGLLHSAMAGVLRLADQIVLVSSPSVDAARSASATLDWLAAHQYGDLVRGAVVVLSAIRPRSKSAVDLARLEQHFAARCRAVVRIPYDAHLEEGAEVDLARLSRATADAYLVLAAEVGDGFSWPRH